jgi:hypothetical protein
MGTVVSLKTATGNVSVRGILRTYVLVAVSAMAVIAGQGGFCLLAEDIKGCCQQYQEHHNK